MSKKDVSLTSPTILLTLQIESDRQIGFTPVHFYQIFLKNLREKVLVTNVPNHSSHTQLIYLISRHESFARMLVSVHTDETV